MRSKISTLKWYLAIHIRKGVMVVVTGYEGGVFGEVALRHCDNSIGRTEVNEKAPAGQRKEQQKGLTRQSRRWLGYIQEVKSKH
jgi:hypothetical protein